MLIWERRLAVITTIATDLAIQHDELVRLRARVKSALAPSPQGGGSAERTRVTAARGKRVLSMADVVKKTPPVSSPHS
jgi:hypothetical protein